MTKQNESIKRQIENLGSKFAQKENTTISKIEKIWVETFNGNFSVQVQYTGFGTNSIGRFTDVDKATNYGLKISKAIGASFSWKVEK